MALGILQGRHAHLRSQLSAYIDGELSPAERFEVEHHIEACPECREELDELQIIAQATGLLPEIPAPRSFILTPSLAGVAATPTRPISPQAPAGERRVPWFLLGWGGAGLAALLLGAGVAHMLTSIGGSSPQPAEPARTNAALPPATLTPVATPLATVAPAASATATATVSVTPVSTPAPVVAGVPAGGGVGAAGGGGTSASTGSGGAASAGGGGQTLAAPVTQPAPAAPAAVAPAPVVSAPVATAPAAVVAAPAIRSTPGAPVAAVPNTGQPAPAPAAAATRPTPPPVTGAPPRVIGAGGSVLVPPPAGAPVPVRAAPTNPTPSGR